MTDITELAQSLQRRATSAKEFGESLYVKADDVLALIETLEKAQGMEAYLKTQCRGITDHCEELQARIAELEREQEHLRPVGVMSEKAFHRLENSECRFIALWPRSGIFLQRKRPEDGVIVYARTAAAADIKVEAE
ncbi:hypothetical protein JQ740_20815 [Klebsiella pneumoniae]|uniref:hypothetical protein n=1 Tax=Klebsiella pneumoniae TaxID=573 RepID=UPI001FABAB6C|nr:hypothetical protein [Klebsiella pneumoniae]MCI8114220.1 hypothetical protein [Klebsiella pneumoniae]GKM66671.1 hypothetical protein NUBL21998_20580 [Klebsiella pneumoniae]HCI9325102.1 hypothetical protein [Klebsiella pneumoniae]